MQRSDRRGHAVGGGRYALVILVAALAAVVMATLPGDGARAQSALTLTGDFTFSNYAGGYLPYPYIAGSPLWGSGAPLGAQPPALPSASGGTAPYTYTLTFTNTQTGATGITPADLGLNFGVTGNTPGIGGTPCAPNASPTPSACPVQGFADYYRATITVTDSATPPASVSKTAPFVLEADVTPSYAASSASHTFAVNRRESRDFPKPVGGNITHTGDPHYSISATDATALKNVGLRLQGGTGHIYGTPTGALAARNVTLTATDRDGDTATITLTITVESVLGSAPRFAQDGYRVLWYYKWQTGEGWPYAISPITLDKRVPLPKAGGSPTTYSLTETALPTGITYTAWSNTLTGEPTQTGTFNLTLTATNSVTQASDTAAITLVVTTAPEPILYSYALTCTRVQLRINQGYASNVYDPATYLYKQTLETVTGWHVQYQRRGESGWQTLHTNLTPQPDTSGYTTTYHEDRPAGSSWAYRVAAITANGQGEWSPVSRISTTRNLADPRGSRTLEAGMVLDANPWSWISGRKATNVRWQRSNDAANLVWTDVSNSAFYTVQPGDVGKLFRAVWDVNHDLEPDLWENDVQYQHGQPLWSAPLPPHTVSYPWSDFIDPPVANAAPRFATASAHYLPRSAGETVSIQLPLAAGGSAPLTYTVTPPLPGGLTLDAATGVISGELTENWAGYYTVTATDADCDQATLTVEVAPPTVALRVTAAVAGPVPPGTRFTVNYTCLGAGGAFHIWPGETRYASVPLDSPCSLSVSDAGGARAVSGTFQNRTFTYETYVTLLFDFTQPGTGADADGDGDTDADADAGPEPDPEDDEPDPVAVTIETRVWQHVDDPMRIYLSARPEGGSWATLGTVLLPLDQRSGPNDQWAYGVVTLDAPVGDGAVSVEIAVVRNTVNGRLYLNARAEGGSWSDLGAIALSLDDGYSGDGSYRYGDTTVAVPLPAASADEDENAS